MGTNKETMETENRTIVLRGKDNFTVSDLKKVLNKFEDNTPIDFGVLKNGSVVFNQTDNFIFETYSEIGMPYDFTLGIITDYDL
tara:strand:- start:693 stop:944 length:252 start_codon:yes stop_codon:yes gene_type:complete